MALSHLTAHASVTPLPQCAVGEHQLLAGITESPVGMCSISYLMALFFLLEGYHCCQLSTVATALAQVTPFLS